MIPGNGYGYGRSLASHGYGYGIVVTVVVPPYTPYPLEPYHDPDDKGYKGKRMIGRQSRRVRGHR